MDDQERDENTVEIINLDSQPVPDSPAWFAKSISKLTQWKQSPRFRTTFFISTFLVCILILSLVLGLHLPSLPFFKQSSAVSSASQKPTIPMLKNPISTAIANNIVYVNTPDGMLSAQQAETGKMIWHITLPHNEYGSLEADNQAVYSLFSTHTGSLLAARSARNGALLWQKQLPFSGFDPLMIDNGILYFDERSGTIDAFRASDGEPLWHFASHFPIPMDSFLWVAGNITIISSIDTQVQVHVLRSSSGMQLFSYKNFMPGTTPEIDHNILYYQSAPNAITALNMNNGHQLWQYTTSGEAFTLWEAQDNQVYLEDDNQQGVLALDGTSGKLVWRYNALLDATPIIQHGILYAPLQGNAIFALRTSNGSLLWQQIVSPFQYGPLAAGDVICLGQNNSIQALGNDGVIRWIYTTHDSISGYPEESNGILLISYLTGNNAFDVIRANDGTVLWQYAL